MTNSKILNLFGMVSREFVLIKFTFGNRPLCDVTVGTRTSQSLASFILPPETELVVDFVSPQSRVLTGRQQINIFEERL